MPLPRPPAALVRWLTVASVVANSAIVVTGGAVRLTSSGLGCPTWPRCTDDSFTPTAEYAQHGVIEFSNRMLTFAVGVVALATLVAVLLSGRRSLRPLAIAAFLGIPAQAVMGGITVLTGLNPWTVAGHFLISMAILAVAVPLAWRAFRADDEPVVAAVGPELRILVWSLLGVTAAVLVLGTVVTGSGPHAGDEAAARTGFDPQTVSQLHADGVMLLVGLTVATLLALRAVRAPGSLVRATAILLVVELAQGLIGFVQYFTGLPVILVGAHLLGACVVWVAALRVALAATDRRLFSAAPTGPAERTGRRTPPVEAAAAPVEAAPVEAAPVEAAPVEAAGSTPVGR
jgi:cytochrome c oxidase assembly protein subunit 15